MRSGGERAFLQVFPPFFMAHRTICLAVSTTEFDTRSMTEALKKGFFGRLRERLTKTRSTLVDNVKRVFAGRTRIDEEVFEELEEILIEADMGVETVLTIVEDMRRISKE